jgi:hypothetical protein
MVVLLLVQGCALNCDTVRTRNGWSLIQPDAEVAQAREAAATDGLLHHTTSWGPETWYRHSSGDMYRCEVIDGRDWSEKGTCSQYGMYFHKAHGVWQSHMGVNNSCQG